jgi:putative intracellular protease/amidase
MFTFDKAHALHAAFVASHEAGKVAAALCHGVAVLRHVKTSDGRLLAHGKTITGFANFSGAATAMLVIEALGK